MRSKKNNQQNLLGIFLIAIILLIFIGLLSVYTYARFSAESISQYNVFLIDVTDKLTPQQKGELINNVEKYINESPKNSWHEVYEVDSTDDELLKPLLKTKSTFAPSGPKNSLTSSLVLSKKLFMKNFVTPFRNLLEESFAKCAVEKSPILESVQSTAITCLNKPEAQNAPRRIILVSDLMQNTKGINFYQGVPLFDDLLKTEAYRKTRTNLEGVKFQIWKLNSRISPEDDRKLLDLWNKIIHDQGAILQEVVKISG